MWPDIIEPLGYKAKEKNEEFMENYSVVVNKWTDEFNQNFCVGGKIIWEKFAQFVSGSKRFS